MFGGPDKDTGPSPGQFVAGSDSGSGPMIVLTCFLHEKVFGKGLFFMRVYNLNERQRNRFSSLEDATDQREVAVDPPWARQGEAVQKSVSRG